MDNEKPTQEELQAVLEELFDRATEHNEQLQKQLAHVRSRVVQLVNENKGLVATREYQSSCLYESFKENTDELNDM
jgi:exonuclease VII small subunit